MIHIHRLHRQTTDQIAAGEVIERPASVVKELIENSLDAGARDIQMVVEKGGDKRIRLQDNGHGIHQEDLALALQRYATSKIKDSMDLQHVASLGFRGEALASICSVARVELTSRHEDMPLAYRMIGAGGNLSEPIPAAHPVGTTIEISDLFYNMPVRRKFLKNPLTEFRNIVLIAERIVLSRFSLEFSIHNGKSIRNFSPAYTAIEYLDRIESILGKNFREAAFEFEFEESNISVFGYVADPRYTRSQPDSQYIYINGRFVRDKVIARAIQQAYHDVLFHGRYPAYILYLEIDPELVDVNVHPSKYEVRFRDSRLVFDFIKRSVQAVLKKIKLGPVSIFSETSESVCVVDLPKSNAPLMGYQRKSDAQLQLQEQGENITGIQEELPEERMVAESLSSKREKEDQQKALHFEKKKKEDIEKSTVLNSNRITSFKANIDHSPPLGYALGQLHGIYILSQNEHGLIIVDMHAAHERILYEKMKKEIEDSELIIQPLLMPIIIHLNTQEQQAWEQYENEMTKIGLDIQALGPKTISLNGLPALLKSNQAETLIRDILSDLGSHAGISRVPEKINAILATLACRAAFHAHHHLTIKEMNALLRVMEETQHGGLCNHGRPTWKQFSLRKLDQFFLRGQ